MTPAQAIAALDRQLARHGQTVILQRGADSLPVRAFVRNYTAEELVGGIIQGSREVVLSPTGQTGVFATEPVDRNDAVQIGGREVNIETANRVLVSDVVVRINLRVSG